MINKDFLKLTNTIYKLLEFFPESDPLKNRAKDKALTIMDNLVLINETSGWASFQKEKIKVQLLEDIDMLLGYLWIGKTQGWLNSVNYLIVVNEYEKIKEIAEPTLEPTQKLPGFGDKGIIQEKENIVQENIIRESSAFALSDRQTPPLHEVTARQRQILEFLEKNQKAQVMDLQTILPDVTKRTIRRDLDELLLANKIVRLGDFNQVFYKIRENQILTS
ncbi:MAG: DeoR family transcriptional regulator [Candidatus Staskawiczbacteria bacterium]|jgi:hypothetical protein